jgi:hypothetical protein
MIWLRSFMEELGKQQENNRLYRDNQSVHSSCKEINLPL